MKLSHVIRTISSSHQLGACSKGKQGQTMLKENEDLKSYSADIYDSSSINNRTQIKGMDCAHVVFF
jgi:hypothetical protein